MVSNLHQYWIYVLSNKTRSVFYIGVTNDLYRRYIEHKNERIHGFTERYKCHYLIYFEEYRSVNEAIKREKELKGWKRDKKEILIRKANPQLKDLAEVMKWNDEK